MPQKCLNALFLKLFFFPFCLLVHVIKSSGVRPAVQHDRDFTVAQAHRDGCKENFKIFDSPFGNFLLPEHACSILMDESNSTTSGSVVIPKEGNRNDMGKVYRGETLLTLAAMEMKLKELNQRLKIEVEESVRKG
ncbi:hypothetical protein RJ640_006736 [Escallonia rubra]|uniref:Uncharacterized protein n=1 Tax=Escallonia rubra TaxID=112253 RepID=A0AA88UHV4_9ASTE|nr:hypothetical protein RJ640_006736 [Escallonia rubra]